MRASTESRLERLERLTGRLKSNDPLTMGALAAEFGVSVRTVARDLDLLRDRGAPVETDRGRGGGVRAHWSWGIDRLKLTFPEAVDLLVSLAVSERMNSPLFMADLKPIRAKLMASFSPDLKRKVERLKSRILIGESASPFVLSTVKATGRKAVAGIHQGFMMMREARIDYCDEKGVLTSRVVQPHYLFLNYPVWYVMAWDCLRDDVRTFRCDRIATAVPLDTGFSLLPIGRFAEALVGARTTSP